MIANQGAQEDAGSERILSILRRIERLLSAPEEQGNFDLKETVAMLWNGQEKSLHPIKRPVRIDLDNIIGVESKKKRLLANTTSFIKGKGANNVLLWGEKGTGKSSLIKGLIKKFSPVGLRMIQVFNQDILSIHYIYDFISRNSYYRFIVFIDDLSFEEDQREYKSLKTILDGGLEEIPENLLFYATSNRRHLVPTRFSDKDNDLVRPSDNLEEKISLVDRFGLRLGFYRIDEEGYLKIVEMYAAKYNIAIERSKLRSLAVQWAIETGGRNGRTAEQFIKNLQT